MGADNITREPSTKPIEGQLDQGPHPRSIGCCAHKQVDTPISRFVMLLSLNGVGCHDCKSRISLPPAVRARAVVVFLAASLPIIPGVPWFVGGLFVSASTIWVTSAIREAALQVDPALLGRKV